MPAPTPVYPGASNAYVPSHESTQGMIVDFSRNPNSFPLNKYIKLFPVEDMIGYYAQFGQAGGFVEEAARITDTSLANFEWPDNNDAPDGKSFRELFALLQYGTHRYGFPWQCGDLLAEQASWSIKDQYARMAAHLAMTARTQKVLSLLATAANWPAAHTALVTAISGVTGQWDVSTTTRADIRRSLDYAVNLIMLDTLSVVRRSDLLLVLSPSCAMKVSRSQEILDYLKQQSNSIKVITGEQWEMKDFQFPAELYGLQVVIEDTVKITNAKGASRSASYILGDQTPFITSRPGALVGTDSKAPNFSTASLFVYSKNEMLVESRHDDHNKRTEGRVVDNYDTQLTAPAAGFLFTSATASNS